jgi:hypothetical protein
MSDTGNESNSDAEPDSPGFVDRGVNADRDLNLDPERAGEPHRVSDREPPRIRDSEAGADDPLVNEETAAAAREAGAIGARPHRAGADQHDPAMAPVREAGGGEAEGFEEAEERLIDNAEHGDFAPDPYNDAFTPERESDRSGAAYGEADHERSSERADDRDRDADAEE